ncbi:prenyltransferase/squalene oxidase repeat-containing protein [Sphingomonas sp.]|uniref:prenyltransferase/squalene oxidase repeat-containing protein n=1 Tax=Sphingomonas sp. TaxID=28214 RepID=UPI00182264E2|nr:prenyltransferase/squalene oxidase repeat-containing protein [Sphingomonas sp.]MBA3512321.1 terpene cyclase/mutase family protein [Sphingomonas sp.]
MIQPARLAGLALASLSDRADEAWLLGRDWVRRRGAREREERSVHAAVRRALAFMRRRQRSDGQFRGFLLLPGASTDWITSHVAFVLEDVPEAQDICRAAAVYLSRVLQKRGACGYNARVGQDCDSTAQALLAVHRFGLPYPPGALDWLLAAQRPEGGFPTYPMYSDGPVCDGWHAAHPDVTAVVILALRRLNAPADRIGRAERWLGAQAVGGLLPAYWWRDPGYGLWVQTRAGIDAAHASSAAARLLGDSRTQPLLAMLTIAAADEGHRGMAAAIPALLDNQDHDGSWPCSPCLRVTNRRCHTASAANPGRVYSDRRRVFATAYALAALAQIQCGGRQVRVRGPSGAK